MTDQRKPKIISFHRSGPMPCPYLPGKIEQQLFTELKAPDAQHHYETLSQAGFRRSHHVAYRPACNGCNACVPVRIVVDEFKETRSWRRILNANSNLTVLFDRLARGWIFRSLQLLQYRKPQKKPWILHHTIVNRPRATMRPALCLSGLLDRWQSQNGL